MRSLVLSLVLAAVAGPFAGAQAVSTASKTIGLSVFGGASQVATDYNHTNYGFTFGGDVTRPIRFFSPSLEVRYTHSSGDPVGEDSFLAGLKAEKRIYGFHPYLDFLIGQGVIHFAHPVVYPTGPYASDNSLVYNFGGGVDYDLTRSFALKAEYQVQSWKLGQSNSRLSPAIATFGVVYRIPFKAFTPHR
jgi:opacity protein-like surface antigen